MLFDAHCQAWVAHGRCLALTSTAANAFLRGDVPPMPPMPPRPRMGRDTRRLLSALYGVRAGTWVLVEGLSAAQVRAACNHAAVQTPGVIVRAKIAREGAPNAEVFVGRETAKAHLPE